MPRTPRYPMPPDLPWMAACRLPRAKRVRLSKLRASSALVPKERVEQRWVISDLGDIGLWGIHAKNEGRHSAAARALLAAEGVRSGFPDVLILGRCVVAGVEYIGLAIELKRADGTPSRVSDAQREWIDRLRLLGLAATWAAGAAEAMAIALACYPQGSRSICCRRAT